MTFSVLEDAQKRAKLAGKLIGYVNIIRVSINNNLLANILPELGVPTLTKFRYFLLLKCYPFITHSSIKVLKSRRRLKSSFIHTPYCSS